MLPDLFIDWWFMPWAYARHAGAPFGPDLLSRRDGYALWCAQAGVAPAVPDRFDPGWQVAMLREPQALARAATLFGGLVAAREQDQATLAQLPLADRRWCMSVAVTQPLKSCRGLAVADDDTRPQTRGLIELARRLEPGFPGMWSRLRLLLAPALAQRIDALLPAAQAAAPPEASPVRAQRCWQICATRAQAEDAAPEPIAA